MDIQGIREGALFAMHNMQEVWSFPLMEVEPTICIELKNEEDEG